MPVTTSTIPAFGAGVADEIKPVYESISDYHKKMHEWISDELGDITEPIYKEVVSSTDGLESISTAKSLEKHNPSLLVGELVDNAHDVASLTREVSIRRRSKSDYFYEAAYFNEAERSYVNNQLQYKLGRFSR